MYSGLLHFSDADNLPQRAENYSSNLRYLPFFFFLKLFCKDICKLFVIIKKFDTGKWPMNQVFVFFPKCQNAWYTCYFCKWTYTKSLHVFFLIRKPQKCSWSFFFFFEDCAISVSVNSCVLHENLIKALQVKTFVSAVFDPPFPLASSYLTANTQAVLKRS